MDHQEMGGPTMKKWGLTHQQLEICAMRLNGDIIEQSKMASWEIMGNPPAHGH